MLMHAAVAAGEVRSSSSDIMVKATTNTSRSLLLILVLLVVVRADVGRVTLPRPR